MVLYMHSACTDISWKLAYRLNTRIYIPQMKNDDVIMNSSYLATWGSPFSPTDSTRRFLSSKNVVNEIKYNVNNITFKLKFKMYFYSWDVAYNVFCRWKWPNIIGPSFSPTTPCNIIGSHWKYNKLFMNNKNKKKREPYQQTQIGIYGRMGALVAAWLNTVGSIRIFCMNNHMSCNHVETNTWSNFPCSRERNFMFCKNNYWCLG